MMEGLDWENFLSLTLKAADSDLNPLTDAKRISIENRLRKIFPRMRNVPDHPTYASMIFRAISELNEEMGSSMEAIVSFIQTEYKNLPWIHLTYLQNQLNNLCNNGEIVITHENLYMLPKGAGESSPNLDHCLTLKQQPMKCENGKRDRPHKNIRSKKAKKLIEDQEMDTYEVEETIHDSIILKFRFVKDNSDTSDAGTSCSQPKDKPLKFYELVVVTHPNLKKRAHHSQTVQLGRGKRNKGKMVMSSLNLNQNQAKSPTPQTNGRPRKNRRLPDENETLKLGGQTEHTHSYLPSQKSYKKMPTNRSKMSLPTYPSIPEGIIIALPAQPRQPRQPVKKQKGGSRWKV